MSTAEDAPGPGEPDLSFLSGIALGRYDHLLEVIAKAIEDRWVAKDKVEERELVAQFGVGDHVIFNDRVEGKMLRGKRGEIVRIDRGAQQVEVCLGRQAGLGRYAGRHLVCTPLIVTKMPGEHRRLHLDGDSP